MLRSTSIVKGHCDLIPQQIFLAFIFLNIKVRLMIGTKFQPNILSRSEEKVDFIGCVIYGSGCHL